MPYNGYATSHNNAVCYNSASGNTSAGIYDFRGDQNIFVDNQTSGNGTNFSVDDSSLIGSQYAGSCQLGGAAAEPGDHRRADPGADSDATPRRRAPACTPRPPVTVTRSAARPGTLLVTVDRDALGGRPEQYDLAAPVPGAPRTPASRSAGSRPHRRQLRSRPCRLARPDDVHGATVHGPFASTVPFSVVDDCGAWQTFVGGGATTGTF